MQVMTYEVLKKFIFVATQMIESEGRAWQLISLRSWDRLAELAVFSGCSSGVVCIASYQQRHKVKFLKLEIVRILICIISSLNIYCRQGICALLGYYAACSVNILPTFRNKQSLSSSKF